MPETVIKIEDLAKTYRLGQIGTGTLAHDLIRWWHLIRGTEDPYQKVGGINVCKEIGRSEYVYALQGIDLEVQRGEVLGIIGKNGAGKSTLLKILSKVTGPTTGKVMLKGQVASLLEVGTGFHLELTGRENIYLNGTIMGMTRHQVTRKLDQIVAFSGIARYLDTPIKRYSSGMKVRLGFAVAAHLEPDILVVDEVLAVGDAEFQQKAVGKMQEVSSGLGRTVLFVSHNMAAIQNLCTRVLVLDQGRSQFIGDTQEGVQRYLHLNTEATKVKLADRRDREGNGQIRFVDYQIEDLEGNPLNVAFSGMPVRVRLDYDAEPGVNTNITMHFYGRDGIILFTCSNVFSGSPELETNANGSVFCDIKKLPLPAGKYWFTVKARGREKIMFDGVENAGEVVVVEGDFYGSSKVPPSIAWGLLVDHKITYS